MSEFILKKSIKIILLLFFVFYLLFHIFSGEYGILSIHKINYELINKKNELYLAKEKLEQKENKINRLKENNLDLDLFDEELKKNVGLMEENEILIKTK